VAPPIRWRRHLFAACGPALLALVLYLLPATHNPLVLFDADYVVTKAASRMKATGNYAPATLDTAPLPCWTVALLGRALAEPSAAAGRIPPLAQKLAGALASTLAVFIAAFYGCLVFGRKAGLLSALILAASFLTARQAWHGITGPFLLLACTVAFSSAAWLVCTPQPGVLAALGLGVGLAAAALNRNYLPLLIALPILFEALLRHRFNASKVLLFIFALLVAALLLSPWYVMLSGPGFYAGLAARMQSSFAGGFPAAAGHWPYFMLRLAAGLLPWTPVLFFVCLFNIFRAPKRPAAAEEGAFAAENLRFLGVAFGLMFLSLYVFPKHDERPLMLLWALLCWLAGYLFNCFRNAGGVPEERLGWSQVALGAVGAAALWLLPWWPAASLKHLPLGVVALRAGLLAYGWPVPIALGLLFLIFHLYLARQCTEGRPLRAGTALALAASACAMAWKSMI
jgi:hypothetical protein